MLVADVASTASPAPRSGGAASASRRLSPAFSQWLDFIRWAAAAAVLVSHAQNRYLVRAVDLAPDERSVLHLAFAFVSGFSHHAVMAFFVLSGYLVGGKMIEGLVDRSFDLRKYALDRVTRLMLVLVPALILTLVIARIIYGNYAGSDARFYYNDTVDNMGLSTFLCNMVFLQMTACNTYGGNGALWTLANEFWYYVTMPALLALLFLRPLALAPLIAVAVAGVAVLLTLTMAQSSGPPIIVYGAIWLIGALAAWLGRQQGAALSPLACGAFYLAIVVALRIFVRGDWLQERWLMQIGIDMLVALCLATWLISLQRRGPKLAAPPLPGLHPLFASFSFSLYCIHVPLLNLVGFVAEGNVGRGWNLQPSDPLAWALVCIGISVCVIAAFLFSWVTERHNNSVRQFLSKLLLRPKVREQRV